MPYSSAVRGRGALATAPQNLHSLQPLSLCLSVLSLRPCEAALGSPLFTSLSGFPPLPHVSEPSLSLTDCVSVSPTVCVCHLPFPLLSLPV